MKRVEIEEIMKKHKHPYIVLVRREGDALGEMCQMKGGYLHDAWGHRVNRNFDFWGYIHFDPVTHQRVHRPLTELK